MEASLRGDSDDTTSDARARVARGQAQRRVAQAKIVGKLMQHNRATDHTLRAVELRDGVVEGHLNVAVGIGRDVAVVADVTHLGRYVTMGHVGRVEVSTRRTTNLNFFNFFE